MKAALPLAIKPIHWHSAYQAPPDGGTRPWVSGQRSLALRTKVPSASSQYIRTITEFCRGQSQPLSRRLLTPLHAKNFVAKLLASQGISASADA